MMPKNYLLIFSLIISFSIFTSVSKAHEHVLANITTDVNTDSYKFIVDVDEFQHLLQSFYIDTYVSGQLTKRDTLPMDHFINRGLTLPKNSKYEFVKMEGQNFDQTLGGLLVIDAVYNILTGKRRAYELQLAQDKSGWRLFYKGRAISSIIALAHKIPIVGIVGAKDLSMH